MKKLIAIILCALLALTATAAFAESVVSKSYRIKFAFSKTAAFQNFFEREIIPTRLN